MAEAKTIESKKRSFQEEDSETLLEALISGFEDVLAGRISEWKPTKK